ncbi:MAG: type I restriction endonuclease subunit R [Spiroplasma sp.]
MKEEIMNMNYVREDNFEEDVTKKLVDLGWEKISDIQRDDWREVFDFSLLLQQIKLINNIDDRIANLAINKIKKVNDTFINMNKQCWKMLVDGIKVDDEKTKLTKTIKLLSENVSKNKYQVVRQLAISDGVKLRKPDIILYINGLPVVVFELKAPLANQSLKDAFDQNESLKRDIPKLWAFNVMNFLSNMLVSRYGSTLAGIKKMHRINNLKTRNGIDIFDYLFNKTDFYQFIKTFSFYSNENNNFIKYMAAPHQIDAVRKTIEKLKITSNNQGGVVWHTQGSGKSVTMVMLAKLIIETINNATIIVVTDRNTLDEQLFTRFLNAKDYLWNEAKQIKSRKDLIEKLRSKKHFDIYFSTVQKFTEGTGILTNRDDVFILVDEAHRTQNNIDEEKFLSKETEEFISKFGFARCMRNAFPNAKIVGFTGTPLMKADKDTTQIFGDYNDIYSMNDAVKDNAIVPIHYEMRKVKINLNEEYLHEMDLIQKEYIKSLNLNDISSQEKIDELLKSVNIKQVLEDDKVIKAKARDILQHLRKRSAVLHGKAIIVATSRKAAFKYYKAFIELDYSLKDKVILVITESNKDSKEMTSAIVSKRDINKVANKFRDAKSEYKIAIVVDMWLTGFDVPDLDVLYIDKFIKWHNLMQAIARVNRTYEDKSTRKVKENGLIVDYIGIWSFLLKALSKYAPGIENTFDFSIEDVHTVRDKLLEHFKSINDSYIKDLYTFDSLNPKEQYRFIITAYEKLLELPVEQKNKFIGLARETKRFFKMSYSVISQKESVIAKCIEIINSFLLKSLVETDENLENTIELIKAAIARTVDSKTSEVFTSESKISKNINETALTLTSEAKNLKKSSPLVAIEFMKYSIKAQLQNLQNIRPVFAKYASDKLRNIIAELSRIEDALTVVDRLEDLNQEIVKEANKPLEFEYPQLQVFYEIVSNDEFLKNNHSSEILKKLIAEIIASIKECGVEQFENNPQVKSKIQTNLKSLLRQKYDYPLEHLQDISNILVEQLTNQIKINKDFFRKDN